MMKTLSSIKKAALQVRIDIRYWWPRHAAKFDVITLDGEQFHQIFVGDRSWVLYDKYGYLFGWHGEDRGGYPFFKKASDVHGDKLIRMPWISRLRSPKIA